MVGTAEEAFGRVPITVEIPHCSCFQEEDVMLMVILMIKKTEWDVCAYPKSETWVPAKYSCSQNSSFLTVATFRQ